MYRLLLLLLPRQHREQHGAEMSEVFVALCAQARRERGWPGVMATWAKESLGMLKFGLRARLNPSWVGPELRWAWRGVRARGWAAIFSIGLLAVAMAANGVVFSVADALVFNPLPYPRADRIVTFRDAANPDGPPSMPKAAFKELTRHSDAVRNLAAYNGTTIFLAGNGAAERVSAVNITPDITNVLGVRPRWGRSLSASDLLQTDSDAVLISESLAAARFGVPAAAVGHTLETTDLPLRVIGVMAKDFRFPGGREQIWRGFDLEGPLARNAFATNAVARLHDGTSLEATAAKLSEGYANVPAIDGEPPYRPAPRPYEHRRQDPTQYLALLGAAACLLLTACANIASVELASAFARARSYAIQRSLGATGWVLARVALIEGGLIVGIATVVGVSLAAAGLEILSRQLPATYSIIPANPIDLDVRVIVVMAATAGAVWLCTSIPVVFFASGARPIDALKSAGFSQAGSTRAALGRRSLTVVQVALAAILLVGGSLFTQTYLSRLSVEKGFDSTNLAEVSLTIPPQLFDKRRSVTSDLTGRLRTQPGVEAVVEAAPPQSANVASRYDTLQIDGVEVATPKLFLSYKTVPWNYHDVLRIPLRSGRPFLSGEPPTQVIVSEQFAKRFWPGGAVGQTFRSSATNPTLQIIGVAGHVRNSEDGRGLNEDRFLYYVPEQPPRPRPAQSAPARAIDLRGSSVTGYSTLIVRMDSAARLQEILNVARSTAPQFEASVTLVDDDYAEWESNTLLQTQVITTFGALAFLTAIAGVYGVMAFLVASRTRELGVRMALGASQRDVVTLVLGSAARLVVIGTIAGLAGAIAASRYVESELFEISPTDPFTYALVAIAVIAGATLATWQPTRRAARVDPAITLRAE